MKKQKAQQPRKILIRFLIKFKILIEEKKTSKKSSEDEALERRMEGGWSDSKSLEWVHSIKQTTLVKRHT